MHKILRLSIFILFFSHHSYAQEPLPQQQNPFLSMQENCIKHVADYLDDKSRSALCSCDKLLSKAAWPSAKVFHVKIFREFLRGDSYWQSALQMLRILSWTIQSRRANNDMILHLPEGEALFLSEELSSFKNLAGLWMAYVVCTNDFYRQEQMANHKRVLEMLPNLKYLSLPWKYNEPLAPTLNQLKKLQSLQVKTSKLTAEDFASMSPSIMELRLHDCKMHGIPLMAKFTSLRFLSLVQTYFHGLEDFLRPLALFLEKLDLAVIEIDTLPACLASFEKLRELDISQNDLSPEALTCLIKLPSLRWINLAGNQQCESHKDLVRKMFPPIVTISYEDTYGAVGFGQ